MGIRSPISLITPSYNYAMSWPNKSELCAAQYELPSQTLFFNM